MAVDVTVKEVEAAHMDAIWALWLGTGWNGKYAVGPGQLNRTGYPGVQ